VEAVERQHRELRVVVERQARPKPHPVDVAPLEELRRQRADEAPPEELRRPRRVVEPLLRR
jgi:hypothetical protein